MLRRVSGSRNLAAAKSAEWGQADLYDNEYWSM
jgi:hypothetical protein